MSGTCMRDSAPHHRKLRLVTIAVALIACVWLVLPGEDDTADGTREGAGAPTEAMPALSSGGRPAAPLAAERDAEVGPAPAATGLPTGRIDVRVRWRMRDAPVPDAVVIVKAGADLRTVRTDAGGRVRVDGVRAGPARVWAAQALHAPGGDEKEVWVAGGGEHAVVFHLDEYRNVAHLEVVDARDGRPVAGADVAVFRGGTAMHALWDLDPRHEASDGGVAPLPLGRTDARGHLEVEALDDEQVFTFVVRADGYRRHDETLHVPLRARRETFVVRVALERGAVLTGRVTNAAGAACPGAFVYVVPEGVEPLLENPRQVISDLGGVWRALRATADGEGRYRIRGLDPRIRYLVVAEGPEDERSLWQALRMGDAGEDARLDLHLVRPGTLVVAWDAKPGQPRHFELAPWPANAGRIEHARTRVRVPVGAHRLRLFHDTLPVLEREVTVASGAEVVVHVEPPTPVPLDGLVTDRRDRPLAGVSVELEEVRGTISSSEAHHPVRVVTTDGQGRFRLAARAPVRHIARVIAPEGLRLARWTVLGAETEHVHLRVVGHGAVTLGLSSAGRELPEHVRVVVAHTRGRTHLGATVRDGRLRLDGVWGERVTLHVRAEGFAVASLEADVHRGETTDLGHLTLRPARRIRGRVVDNEGQAVGGATVFADPVFETTTDDAGRFALDGVDDRERRITVMADGFVRTRLTAGPGDSLRVRLSRGTRIAARIQDAEGYARPHVHVDVREVTGGPDEPRLTWVRSDTTGRFTVRVPAGRWRLIERGAKGNAQVVDVREGEDQALVLRWSPRR